MDKESEKLLRAAQKLIGEWKGLHIKELKNDKETRKLLTQEGVKTPSFRERRIEILRRVFRARNARRLVNREMRPSKGMRKHIRNKKAIQRRAR